MPLARLNYYTALLFKDRPDLHLTIRYYKSQTPLGLASIIKRTNEAMVQYPEQTAFRLHFDRPAMFGFQEKVRVLLPFETTEWPEFINLLNPPKSWGPHVTCENESLSLLVDSVGIMTKNRAIATWRLQSEILSEPLFAGLKT